MNFKFSELSEIFYGNLGNNLKEILNFPSLENLTNLAYQINLSWAR